MWYRVLAALLVLAASASAAWLLIRHRARRRQAALARLLDLADETERLLHRIRARMQAVQDVVERVPSDIGAVAHASLEQGQLIRGALKEVLQHRLWIQRHGAKAPMGELDAACRALELARSRLADDLARLGQAGDALADATDPAGGAGLASRLR